jgi:hypothetical protein
MLKVESIFNRMSQHNKNRTRRNKTEKKNFHYTLFDNLYIYLLKENTNIQILRYLKLCQPSKAEIFFFVFFSGLFYVSRLIYYKLNKLNKN